MTRSFWDHPGRSSSQDGFSLWRSQEGKKGCLAPWGSRSVSSAGKGQKGLEMVITGERGPQSPRSPVGAANEGGVGQGVEESRGGGGH